MHIAPISSAKQELKSHNTVQNNSRNILQDNKITSDNSLMSCSISMTGRFNPKGKLQIENDFTEKFLNVADDIVLGLKTFFRDVCSKAGINTTGVKPLESYTRSWHINMNKSHADWMRSRKDLFKDVYPNYRTCWAEYSPKDQHHGAWKMHIYSDTESDWREMCDVIIPYLKDRQVEWKTFNSISGVHDLNGGIQQGKAFTVYPKNNDEMAQIAKDLDYIIRRNKLEISDTHIVGDNNMGNSGRLFYRYEYNSGAYKDEILDLSKRADKYKYHERYDSNRGEGKYLADDMTLEDDIWRFFDPSNPNAKPLVRRQSSMSSVTPKVHKTRLQRGQTFVLRGPAKLNLANVVDIDLNDVRIKSRIDNLPEGGSLTVGRLGDIQIDDPTCYVSRVHLVIEKQNGKILITDTSTNGTVVTHT